jgi:hypothetical protein
MQNNSPERLWRVANYVFGAASSIGLFVWIKWSGALKPPPQGAFEIFHAGVFSVLWGFVATLYVIGIPSRIVMNLVLGERRRSRWKETAVLLIAFSSLSWALYILVMSHGDGD